MAGVLLLTCSHIEHKACVKISIYTIGYKGDGRNDIK